MIEIIRPESPSRWKPFGYHLLSALNQELWRSEQSGYSLQTLYQDERTLVGLAATGLARSDSFKDSVVHIEAPSQKKGLGGNGRADMIISGGAESIHETFPKTSLWIEAKRHREKIIEFPGSISETWFGFQERTAGDPSIRKSLISQARRDYQKVTKNGARVVYNPVDGIHFGSLIFCLSQKDGDKTKDQTDAEILKELSSGFQADRIIVGIRKDNDFSAPPGPENIEYVGMRIRRRPTVISTYWNREEDLVLVTSLTVFTERSAETKADSEQLDEEPTP